MHASSGERFQLGEARAHEGAEPRRRLDIDEGRRRAAIDRRELPREIDAAAEIHVPREERRRIPRNERLGRRAIRQCRRRGRERSRPKIAELHHDPSVLLARRARGKRLPVNPLSRDPGRLHASRGPGSAPDSSPPSP